MLNMKSKIFKYIYAMLCLLPGIAVGVTCFYVANNENAYQSYSGEKEEVKTYTNDYIEDLTYYFNANGQTLNDTNIIPVSFLDIKSDRTGINDYYNNNQSSINGFRLHTVSTNTFIFSLYSDSTQLDYWTIYDTQFLYLNFITNNTGVFGNDNLFYTIRFNDFAYLDNVFYYSLDKVENSNVFSWVKSNFLYSGVNQFVGIFGGTNSNISFYLTWVLTISLCYLGFEVLMLFINMARNLIHSFTDKDRW